MTPASKPRVLFLNHVATIGGAELDLIDMARHFSSNCQVTLLADGPLKDLLEAAGVKVTVLAASQEISGVRRGSGALRAARSVPHVLGLSRKIARQAKQFDVIWANSQKSFVIGAFASAFARRPLVWHLHDMLTAEHFSPANRHVAVRLANRFATRVVTVSHASQASFTSSGGRAELATVIYNGIDSSLFANCHKSGVDDETEPNPIRAQMGLVDVALVGVFGRITPWKGQDVLIRALPALPDVHVLLVGETWSGERGFADSLKQLAASLGVADRVHFTGFRDDIPELMRAVDVVAHTSKSPEPFGRVIVEAMLARKPVVATAAGGAAEIITHLEDGVLVPPGDSTALADAIRQLLQDPALAATMAAEGYKTATSRFSLPVFLDAIEAVASLACRRYARITSESEAKPMVISPEIHRHAEVLSS
jgi:glycosyltransferase involved in cell wall biosynthesis